MCSAQCMKYSLCLMSVHGDDDDDDGNDSKKSLELLTSLSN